MAIELIGDRLKELHHIDYSIEWVGKKMNCKTVDPTDHPAMIIVHGSVHIKIPPSLRNFEGFKKIFQAIPTIEGLVAYLPNGQIVKIRRDMYSGMYWPPRNVEPLRLSERVALL